MVVATKLAPSVALSVHYLAEAVTGSIFTSTVCPRFEKLKVTLCVLMPTLDAAENLELNSIYRKTCALNDPIWMQANWKAMK